MERNVREHEKALESTRSAVLSAIQSEPYARMSFDGDGMCCKEVVDPWSFSRYGDDHGELYRRDMSLMCQAAAWLVKYQAIDTASDEFMELAVKALVGHWEVSGNSFEEKC